MPVAVSSPMATTVRPSQPITTAQPSRASKPHISTLASPFLASRSALRLPPGPVQRSHARGWRPVVRAMAPKKRGKLMPGGGEPDREVDKEERVRDAMGIINDKYGANTATFLDDSAKRAYSETFPSGALTLDIALGGGLPRGRIVEIYGQESSGKTTLALHAIAQVQRQGGIAWVVDAEHALDLAYARQLGVQTDKLVICQAEEADKALEIVDTAMRGFAADVVVIDSVPALIPSQELESEMGQESIGLLARLMSKVLKKLSASAGRSKCTVIFLNQMRNKINTGGFSYGNPETTTGGVALRYYSSVRLELRNAGKIKSGKDEEDVGIRVRCKVAKSKVCVPYRTAEFDLLFGSGISHAGCVLDCAESMDVVQRKGSWYSFNDDMRVQGRENAIAFLNQYPRVCDEIEQLVRAHVSSDDEDRVSSEGEDVEPSDDDLYVLDEDVE
ncbi:hypothetical protein CLOM_g20427 [Closterium sp. NIES-68]|nr:hypothetical protein CLOM_g20427 [Closterium sp. NIES-68]